MLRNALQQALKPAFSGARSLSARTKVADKMIALTVVDSYGIRVPVLGTVGQTLAQALAGNPNLADSCPTISPVHGNECHISVAKEYLSTLPDITEEEEDMIFEFVPTAAITPNSRLASQIRLNRDLNGLTLAVQPLHPWKTL
ncbi:hypothetical protein CYMTET_18175 [Cymbomonas tetramitiformis]|uniref:Uncharacterized protein n=1 Tax=Cymbomonas tetramitiformis TaxID=36881 RepID=A0AAE0G9Y5_9CHLO|nr:hypothetical protein CYMTET_18175 [Cymbomonas tetramitiformis]